MQLVLVSAAALTLVGGTAVSAQPVGFGHRTQQPSDRRFARPARDAAPSRHWARGQTVPAGYRTPDNYVDYRPNHLHRPHTWRRWVKVDNDNFAEVSPTTGLIYQIIGPH